MHTRVHLPAWLLFFALFIMSGVQASAGTARFIDDNDTVVLHGNTHPLARAKASGLAPSSLPMQHMIMALKVPAARQGALDQYLKDLQDPSSPNYHKWLTPEQYGAKFGPSSDDVAAVGNWLASRGFKVEEVAKGRGWINFSGDVNKVEQTFRTQIKNVELNGHTYHANASAPSIPRGLSDLVSGVVTLHNIPRKPKNNGPKYFPDQEVPNYTSGSAHYLAPGDFATIYDVNSLYSAGVDGTGESIAIVGRTHPSSSNWSSFRSMMGLPANLPQVIVNGPDPGDLGGGEDTEADLDVEWSGAVARKASILFVVSQSTNSTDGVDLSAQYIVSNNLAPVMSVSFGSCEADMGSTESAFYNSLWSQAAAQGISVFVSSGDSGASGCSDPSLSTGSALAVNGLASTPYNVAVGGTQFNEGSGTYWNSVNSTGYVSATGYIPEVAWNESGSVSGGSGLWSTGGGASQVYGKPSWQAAPGVPQDGRRDLPDVSLSAAGHDSYLVYSNGSLAAVGGTSASSPSFAGLMALVVQKTGQRQGNANVSLYRLASSQYAAGGASVFHDVTASNNSVPGVTGYSAGTAYDLATGLGSVDAYAMVNGWGGGASTGDFSLAALSSLTVAPGQGGSEAVQVTVSGGFDSSVSLAVSGLASGITAAISPASLAAPGSGSATLTVSVGSTVAAGNYTLTVTGSGGGVTHSQSFSLTVPSAADFSMSVAAPSGVIQGSSATIKIATTVANGFNSAVALSVSGLPSGVTGSFSPASIAAPGSGSSTLTLTLSASAALGTRNITITATGEGVTHSVQVPLTVVSGVLFSSSFNDTWYVSQVSGTAGKWSILKKGSNPAASPHTGSAMAQFNSYSAPSGNQTRILSGAHIAVPGYAKSATFSFWVYHDTGRPTFNDDLQAQVSTNGSTWANVGSTVSRYNGTSGWSQVSVDLGVYLGQTVMIGVVGTSAGGYNMYLDDVAVTVK